METISYKELGNFYLPSPFDVVIK